MNKAGKVLALIGVGAVVVSIEVVRGYLDIMYKETLPPTLIKRISTKNGLGGFDVFNAYNEKCNEWLSEQPVEVIDRINPKGYNLKGYLLMNEYETKNFVLFAHGYRADHNGDPANFEQFYIEEGYNFMSVDHVAAGDSEGDFVGFDYFEADDMLGWIDYLINRFGEDISIILHGVSMGGATVCQMASRVPSQVKAIISDCAYTSAHDEFVKVANDVGVKKTVKYVYNLVNFMNKKMAGYDLEKTDVRNSVKNSKVPMLFVHGEPDDFVPVSMCHELYDVCSTEKDILIVKDAMHAQSIMTGGEEYKAKIKEFLSKYI